MKRAEAFVATATDGIAMRTARLGERVDLDAGVLDRSDGIVLAPPGVSSANGSCRLIEASDGWVAANLPRADDRAMVPALLAEEVASDAWGALSGGARTMRRDELVSRADMLGLALAAVGETAAAPQACVVRAGPAKRSRDRLRVLDFSSLWAGPLCGAVFAAMGADVTKIESIERPDPTPNSAPQHDQRLNGAKRRRSISLALNREVLLEEIQQADVLITSARARALTALGVTRDLIDDAGMVWIAITGHGYDSSRVAFGDDAAASGGLVRWEDGQPRFIGDALADPLTGLAAANAALALLERGRSGFVDAALARTAAYVAALGP